MNGPLEIRVDGVPTSERWPLDRSLQYGDGLFETMLVRRGRIRFEALHRARLEAGCRRLGIGLDAASTWNEAEAVARARGEATLKLQVSRGDAVARGYTPAGTEHARIILSVFAPPAPTEQPARIRVATLRNRLGENPDLAGLKHCNRLEQVLARRALAGSGAFEGLMASSSGLLVSGTMSNVFLELDGRIVTPALDRCGVAGVLRAVVLREAPLLGHTVQVTTLALDVLDRCTGLALSNARMGLVVADELDGRVLAGGASLRELAATVADLAD